ncbi:MAG: hypothetical protein FWE76_07750 [Symbiobacteriaceae bacterium]|nr:hypothetical protein [Symbiobacteriaceae bacterium]
MIKDLFATSGFSLPKHPTELRLQRNSTRRIGLLSGNLVTNADAVVSGASARVCDRGVYGFASIADMSESGVAKVLLAAAENAQFLGQRAANNLGEMPPLAPCHEPLVKQAPEIPQRTLLDFVRVIDNHIATSYTNLSGRSVGANCLDTEKLLYSTDGEAVPVAFSHSLVPRANIVISLTINDSSGAPVSLSKSYGGYGFFNELFTSPDDLYGQIAILYEKLLHKSEGVMPKPERIFAL